jgi:hypothetical protein
VENIGDDAFRSIPKRELELLILKSALDAGLINRTPAQVAITLKISLAKANSYLTDLALRSPALEDPEALSILIQTLKKCEVLREDSYITIPINDAGVRIWLERKLSESDLQQGESLRRDLVKLSPRGLLSLIDASKGLQKPAAALKLTKKVVGNPSWLSLAENQWSSKTDWKDTLSVFSNAATLAQALPILIGVLVGA